MASSARSVRSSLLSFIEELSGRCSLFAFRSSPIAACFLSSLLLLSIPSLKFGDELPN